MQRKQARDFLPYSRYGILGKYICSFLDLLKGFGLCEIFAHLTPVGWLLFIIWLIDITSFSTARDASKNDFLVYLNFLARICPSFFNLD